MGNDSLVNTSKIEYHPNGKVKKNIFYYNSELQTIMIYNTKGDQIEIKHFVNGEVSVIESFDYDYDNKQNWILKTVSQKYFSNENGDFNQVKRVERDIDYYGCFSILNLF